MTAGVPGSRRCGVLGDPIAHSLSPVLHSAAYRAMGLDWRYGAHLVSEQGLEEFLAGLDRSWRGLSLTMPLKRTVLALVDTASERALLAGAANTVLLEGGLRHADNTDIPGAMAAIRERYDGPLGAATVLGGGATATSALLALAELGCTRVRLLVRDEARAQATLAAARRHSAGLEVEVGDVATDVATGELLVSTIPATVQTAELVSRCADVPVVFDVLYDPWPTPLAARAAGDGRVLVTGLDLLVHQAAVQFELFTGLAAPVTQMRRAGERALAARAG